MLCLDTLSEKVKTTQGLTDTMLTDIAYYEERLCKMALAAKNNSKQASLACVALARNVKKVFAQLHRRTPIIMAVFC